MASCPSGGRLYGHDNPNGCPASKPLFKVSAAEQEGPAGPQTLVYDSIMTCTGDLRLVSDTPDLLEITGNTTGPIREIHFAILDGMTGPTGSQGESITGPTGSQGESITGPTGESITGHTGESITGPTGESITGPTGEGITGPTGPTGESIMGSTGPTGESIMGSTGPTGSQGESITGPTGSQGESITGPTGEGIAGPTGPAGEIVTSLGFAAQHNGKMVMVNNGLIKLYQYWYNKNSTASNVTSSFYDDPGPPANQSDWQMQPPAPTTGISSLYDNNSGFNTAGVWIIPFTGQYHTDVKYTFSMTARYSAAPPISLGLYLYRPTSGIVQIVDSSILTSVLINGTSYGSAGISKNLDLLAGDELFVGLINGQGGASTLLLSGLTPPAHPSSTVITSLDYTGLQWSGFRLG